ncbi:RidA family protein [Aquimarina aquimarini]|uniref:RidA family protein n=2 Tax=Aquimarina aquimarini TaxID=1191734 RepID=UPI001F24547B|nr:RidA family protein [Aquimarina aquimarini]
MKLINLRITSIVLLFVFGSGCQKPLTKNKINSMQMKNIEITPDPYKPYNLAQGYVVGEVLYISGQAAYGETGELVGINDFDVQAEQTFKNLKKVLEAGGSSLKNVVKVTIFLRDMANFNKIVALRKKYFTAPYPADTIVEVSALYSPEALIEIEAIAVLTK